MIDKEIFLKLLKKSLLYRLMTNLDRRLISKTRLTHREISYRTGNSHSWFNDAYNNIEDISISSFIKVLSVIKPEIESLKQPEVNFQNELINLLDGSILKIASIIGELSDEEQQDIAYFIRSDQEFYREVLVDWITMKRKNKLNNAENRVVDQVENILEKRDYNA